VRAALLLLALEASGCAVAYEARHAPLGEPTFPAARAEGVSTLDAARVPGLVSKDSTVSAAIVSADGLMLKEVDDETKSTVLVSARVAAGGAPLEIRDMIWSPPSAPRCAGGHPVIDLLLPIAGKPNHTLASDIRVHWERPLLVRGETVVTGRFDEDPQLLQQPSVVDLLVVEHAGDRERETCVRVPITGPEIAYWNKRKWSVGLRFGVQGSLAFHDGGTLTAGFSVGRWVGPVRLGVEGLFGGSPQTTVDDEAVTTGPCYVTGGPDCNSTTIGGAALEASGLAWRWSRWGLGWSLAYEAIFGSVHHPESMMGPAFSRHASSGGPRLGLRIVRVTPSVLGAARIAPTTGFGFEAFAAAAQVWSGPSDGPGITGGLALIGF
jgi:hypothetical protein